MIRPVPILPEDARRAAELDMEAAGWRGCQWTADQIKAWKKEDVKAAMPNKVGEPAPEGRAIVPSSKSLFKATKAKPKRDARQGSLMVLADSTRPEQTQRRALDLYPTGQPEAIRALLSRDGQRIADLGSVWEPAAGHGDLSREIEAFGLPCTNSDIADHGADQVQVRSFYEFQESLAPAIITNPPYCEINARDGHGRWLRHTLSLTGWRYCALLLSWDWPAARANGLGELLNDSPFSYCYLMRWKLDFTGEGSPPQRNAWFVWDRDWQGSEPSFRWLDKTDWRQEAML